MDKLKEYIKNNRRKFDDIEPTDGHIERFAARLNARQPKQPKRSIRILVTAISGIAAAILVALMVLPTKQAADSCTLSSELAEVSGYYATMLEQEIEKIQQLVAYTDSETKAELLSDIMIMREESSEFLQQICASHMDDADSIPFVVMHYQGKIDALQVTVSLLEGNINS